ncbi:hypothetical protein ABFS82_14G007700 [Erythranthe guttata]|uniref:RING-type E3 ubiquitin transferase n=1 Tax=Erythranthe guttata TaxID=4155 RepID=A0A022RZX1_ERYGU|nr:PREDICTED: RING-H2 finger protein ATL5-like [Erythranthe guttata]EYU45541.1 hypothetical protein MIMGU_mgv1a013568mg [Erythranthe guttata]|eukprot:XP_012840742.1 PREDICTED: RING-H2 finger protein ATL5-like [Erythranthe guttata]
MDRELIGYFSIGLFSGLGFTTCLRFYFHRRHQRRIAALTQIEDEAVDRIVRDLRRLFQNRAVFRGLEPAVLNSVPTLLYPSTAAPEHRLAECAVCLSEFEENECLRLLPKCGHFFHLKCVDKWFLSATTCPLCRTVVEAVVVEDPSMEGESIERGIPSQPTEPVDGEIVPEPDQPVDGETVPEPVEPAEEEILFELVSRFTGRIWQVIAVRRRLAE